MQLVLWSLWAGYLLDITGSSQVDNNIYGASEKLLASEKTESFDSVLPKNFAALIPSEGSLLEVAEVSYPKHSDDELVIENHVVAVNPVDWKIQSSNIFNLTYPTILGEDVAGVVVKVGSNLKDKFHAGQRVIAHTSGLANGPAYGGFQLYPILNAELTSVIPHHVSLAEAAVLPLSISTAAAGLFLKSTLSLNYPNANNSHFESLKTTKDLPILLLWGGSSSVGSTVIQLASAAGYTVVTTASPSNYKYCKNLGAAYVLDYHNPGVVATLVDLLKGKKVVGAYDAIGSDQTVRQNAAILHAIGGGKIASVGLAPSDLFNDVTVSRISSGNIVSQEPEVAKVVWGEYVPWALKHRKLVPSPEPLIVGRGLIEVQAGLDRQKLGVSARKVEVILR